jgi:hypothetical protein
MPECSDQGVGEGKDGLASSMAVSPRVGRRWGGGISSTAAGSAVAVMTVSSGVGEMRRGGRQGSVRVAGCSGAFYRAEGRSRGGRPLKGRWRRSGAPLRAVLGGDRSGGGK